VGENANTCTIQSVLDRVLPHTLCRRHADIRDIEINGPGNLL
jgi:hypothetical protein